MDNGCDDGEGAVIVGSWSDGSRVAGGSGHGDAGSVGGEVRRVNDEGR